MFGSKDTNKQRQIGTHESTNRAINRCTYKRKAGNYMHVYILCDKHKTVNTRQGGLKQGHMENERGIMTKIRTNWPDVIYQYPFPKLATFQAGPGDDTEGPW